MIQLNKPYTITDMLKEFNISKQTWTRRKQDILEHLHIFYDFKYYQPDKNGQAATIIFTYQYAEYEPLPRKSKKKEVEHFYSVNTHQIIDEYPLNTGSNVARIIRYNNNKYKHAQSTAERYVRPILNSDYSPGERVWCKLINNIYTPLVQEELDYLKKCFNSQNEIIYSLFEEIADYEGLEENDNNNFLKIFSKAKSAYEKAMLLFISEYDFRPLRVPTWTICAW